jgi:hypothetical protein
MFLNELVRKIINGFKKKIMNAVGIKIFGGRF